MLSEVKSAKDWPKVSFVMPVLNAQKYLNGCLQSLLSQDYPKEKIEIILADGGSTDKTVEIAKKHKVKLFSNKLKTSESGKAIGLKNSTGDLICFVDSDNLLVGRGWLKKMVTPLLEDDEIIGTNPFRFEHRKKDGYIDRYCALMGMNDPLVFWFGTYDRHNTLKDHWTGLKMPEQNMGDYLKVTLQAQNIPTIGANGTIFRKSVLQEKEFSGDYLFDMDVLETIVEKHGPQKFAVTKVGVVHLYCGSDFHVFFKKQNRRVRDFLFRRSFVDVLANKNFEERRYNYANKSSLSFILKVGGFVLCCVTIVPLIYQSFKGYFKKPDVAWFAHPLLCYLTLLIYTAGALRSFVKRAEYSRVGW